MNENISNDDISKDVNEITVEDKDSNKQKEEVVLEKAKKSMKVLQTENTEIQANTISPDMTLSEVNNVIKNATNTIKVKAGTYKYNLNFNSGKDVELLGHVVVLGTVTFNNCTIDGKNNDLTIGTVTVDAEGSETRNGSLNVNGALTTIKNVKITVNSQRVNFATDFSVNTINIENSTLDSSNNPNGSGIFIGSKCKTVNTVNSDIIANSNGVTKSYSGIWANADGNPNIIFNMEGGSLQMDGNGLNGFLGSPAPLFGGTASKPTFNLHNVNVSACGNGVTQPASGKADGFSYGYITLTSDTGNHVFNVSNNTNNGIDGGRGNNCAFNAKNYTIIANNNGNYGIHISKDTSTISNCTITANNNGTAGFYTSVNTTLEDTKITANENGTYGIYASKVLFVNNSDVTANKNQSNGIYTYKEMTVDSLSSMSLEGNTTKATGKGALYVAGGKVTIQKGAKVSITKNLQSGIYINSKTATVNMETGIVNENGYSVVKEDEETKDVVNAVSGGGVYNKGTFTMGEDARIYNNLASKNGDDIYNASGATLNLIDEPEEFKLVLNDDDHIIDGWYYDGKGDSKVEDGIRWNVLPDTKDEDLYYVQEKDNLVGRTDEIALKAAHKLLKYKVTVNFLEEGSDKVLKDTIVSDLVRENTSYDVSSYLDTEINDYVFVRAANDGLQGKLDKDKVINLYYRRLNRYTVKVKYFDIDTNETISTDQVFTDIVEGSEYNVTQYDQININEYTYVRTDGHLTGIADGDKVVNVYYQKVNNTPKEDDNLNSDVLGDKVENKDKNKPTANIDKEDSLNSDVLGDKLKDNSKTKNKVKTSDNQEMIVYMIAGIVALMGISVLIRRKKYN